MHMRVRLFSVVAAGVLCVLGGCTFTKQFSETAGPLAGNVNSEMTRYIDEMPDGDAKTDEAARLTAFTIAIDAGNRDAALPLWFDVPGIRDSYLRFLGEDQTLQTADGQRVLGILYRNVQAMDYILAIGPKTSTAPRPPPTPPPVPPPVR
jgi:hypothetical protein